MAKFIIFTGGVLSARYDSDIHGDNIPDGAVQVDDELFFQTINEVDGQWQLVDGEIVKGALPDPVIIPPTIVSMRQARLALLAADLLTAVNDAVAQMPVEAQIEWEYATSVDRNSPLVAGLATLLSLDEEALDNLFLTARQL